MVDDLFAPTRALLDTREALEGVQYLVDLDVKLGLSAGDPRRSGGLTAAQLWAAGRLGIYHTSIWSHKVWARDLQFEWDQVVPSRQQGPGEHALLVRARRRPALPQPGRGLGAGQRAERQGDDVRPGPPPAG